jgi:hypothetical protein
MTRDDEDEVADEEESDGESPNAVEAEAAEIAEDDAKLNRLRLLAALITEMVPAAGYPLSADENNGTVDEGLDPFVFAARNNMVIAAMGAIGRMADEL